MILEFRNAFDSTNHDILFQNLHFIGILGMTCELLAMYLTDGIQFIEIEDNYTYRYTYKAWCSTTITTGIMVASSLSI